MNISKKLVFSLLLAAFLSFTPFSSASADSGRYLIKSTKGFWKNAFGIRHSFDNTFSSELSDFQVRLAKVFGVEIEPIPVLQILPDIQISQVPQLVDHDQELNGQSNQVESSPSATPTASPNPTISAPKSLKGRGGVTRYLPSDQTPWGIEAIYDTPLIVSTSGGDGVNVAVLDTGVLSSHPDLAGRITQCKDFTNIRFPVVDGKCDDKNGHGTHVAGIIAADAGNDGRGIYGVAPQANILAYKVCGTDGSCYADDIAAALRLAVDDGAQVINMSFGSDQEISIIKDSVNYAFSKGALMVAAAGNDGPFPASIDYPAAYDSVIAVGAINKSLVVTDWSSRGINSTTTPLIIEERDIELATPGEYVESTWNNGSYVILSGTSMASPFVAGLAAKYWQSTASDSFSATREFLRLSASDLLPLGEDNGSGFGLPRVNY